MKISEFNAYYKAAQSTIVIEDSFFNYNGWFWLGLTQKQYLKMLSLMKAQGAIIQKNKKGKEYIELKKSHLILYIK